MVRRIVMLTLAGLVAAAGAPVLLLMIPTTAAAVTPQYHSWVTCGPASGCVSGGDTPEIGVAVVKMGTSSEGLFYCANPGFVITMATVTFTDGTTAQLNATAPAACGTGTGVVEQDAADGPVTRLDAYGDAAPASTTTTVAPTTTSTSTTIAASTTTTASPTASTVTHATTTTSTTATGAGAGGADPVATVTTMSGELPQAPSVTPASVSLLVTTGASTGVSLRLALALLVAGSIVVLIASRRHYVGRHFRR